tara:strand:+ start:139 stop:528 length:390 start_codon:yes stop_codon:yes gene_type:complete
MTLSFVETEDQLQIRVAQWLDLALPPGAVWHHSPNEGNRHVSYKVKQKRMGTKAGWPDIEIFVPGDQSKVGISISIFIELKRPKGGKLSENQAMVRDKLELAGCFWQLCRSIDQVDEFLEGLIKLRRIK